MANQPPVRPWFRLASLRSVPAPAPAPAPAPVPVPEPRAAQVFPATSRTASAPSSPSKEQVPPPPTPAPARATAPPPPAPAVANSSSGSVAKPSSAYSPPKASTTAHPNGSPKTVTVAVQSPKGKPTAPVPAPPPSPLTLPPSQVRASTENERRIPPEAEPKAVLIEKTISRSSGNGEHRRESGETRMPGNAHSGKHVAGKEIEGKEKGIHKKFSDPDDSGTRVITLAGENRGAVMEIVQPAKKHEFGEKPNYLHKKGNLKIKTSDAESGTSSNDEADLSKKDKNLKGRTSSAFPKTAFVNSNVQCVNNSLMYHTSCQHNDPGVHLVLQRKPSGEGFHVKERVHGQK